MKNPSDLDGLNPETQAVRISAAVGNRKRTIIHTRADQLGLRILNRRRIQRRGTYNDYLEPKEASSRYPIP